MVDVIAFVRLLSQKDAQPKDAQGGADEKPAELGLAWDKLHPPHDDETLEDVDWLPPEEGWVRVSIRIRVRVRVDALPTHVTICLRPNHRPSLRTSHHLLWPHSLHRPTRVHPSLTLTLTLILTLTLALALALTPPIQVHKIAHPRFKETGWDWRPDAVMMDEVSSS